MDPFGTGQVLPPLQVPHPTVQDTIVPPLKKPPKWVRRPVGASFAVSEMLEKVFKEHTIILFMSDVLILFFFPFSLVES